jgi:hypothetical protein
MFAGSGTAFMNKVYDENGPTVSRSPQVELPALIDVEQMYTKPDP